MNQQSDFGYSTGAVPMTCIACGSVDLNCCDGSGRRYTHKITNDDGQFIAGFFDRESAEKTASLMRQCRDLAGNFYEAREV